MIPSWEVMKEEAMNGKKVRRVGSNSQARKNQPRKKGSAVRKIPHYPGVISYNLVTIYMLLMVIYLEVV
jgi:hypothetical protein